LELAARQTLLQNDRHQRLKTDLEKVARMLSGLINGLEKRRSPIAPAMEPVNRRIGEQSKRQGPRWSAEQPLEQVNAFVRPDAGVKLRCDCN
jgi:hypothetical protein